MFKKISPLFALFAAFILCLFLAAVIMPDRTFSENENKVLTPMPEASIERIIDGRFETGYENYVADQFPLRDSWIGMKSISEYALMKGENNGIVYGDDDYLFAPVVSVNGEQMSKNISAISDLAMCYDNVSLMVVPSSDRILADKMPSGYPSVNQTEIIGSIYAGMPDNVNTIDVGSVLAKHSDEYIYYRTDHHWTTRGAYLAYLEFADSMGFAPVDTGSLNANTVEGFLGTSYSKSKNFNVVPDTITYYDSDAVINVNGTDHDIIYNFEQFSKRDKYAGFLWGNSPISTVKNEKAADPDGSILVIRDSYADCFVPFLAEQYGTIDLVDLRYFRGDLAELCLNADEILILYGFSDIVSDVNVPQMTSAVK